MAWSKDETAKLIDILAKAEVQAQLEGCHRNRDVYEKMAQDVWMPCFRRAGKFENGIQSA